MPNPKTALEEWRADEAKLRGQRLELEREIADKLAEQNRVYMLYVRPYSAEAKAIQTATRDARMSADAPLPPEVAKHLEGATDPTSLFERGRSEMARLSAEVTTRRRRLKKVEETLENVRKQIGRLTHASAGAGGAGTLDTGGAEPGALGHLGQAEARAGLGAGAGDGLPGLLGEWVDSLRARTGGLVASVPGSGRGVRA